MDPIAAMLGLGTESEQDLKALAESLRGRQQAADFFSLSTVPQIAKGAQNEQELILDGAERGGEIRQRGLQRAMTQGYYDQLGEQDERDFEADEKHRRLTRAIQAQKQAPQTQVEAEIQYTAPKTKDERAKFDKGASDASAMVDLQNTFEDDFGIQKGDVPWTGDLTNWLGRTVEGVAPEKWGEKALWWSDYKNRAELVQRHELFGSALTRTEQGEWRKATISPNDGPKFIREKLAVRARLAKKVAEADAARALQRGYDPDQVLMNFGDAVDVEALIPRVADGSYFDELGKRQKADRDLPLKSPESLPTLDAVGGDVPTMDSATEYPPHWTPEDIAEYEAMKNG